MSRRFDDDICEDLRDDTSDVSDTSGTSDTGRCDDHRRRSREEARRDCNNHDDDRKRRRRRRRRCDCCPRERRVSRTIPIGTVTVDCTPVIFKSNQCPCPRFC